MKSWALCLVLHLKRYCIILITLVFPLFCWWSPCFHRTACHSCPWIFRLTDILYSQHTSCLAVAAMVRGVGKGWFSLTPNLFHPRHSWFWAFFPPFPWKGNEHVAFRVPVHISSVEVDPAFTSIMVFGYFCLLCLWKVYLCPFYLNVSLVFLYRQRRLHQEWFLRTEWGDPLIRYDILAKSIFPRPKDSLQTWICNFISCLSLKFIIARSSGEL